MTVVWLLATLALQTQASDDACPCKPCPCEPASILPRTCDPGSAAADLGFCDASRPVEERVADLVSRLTRREKIELVAKADTGFLPRLNVKEFDLYHTCFRGWWAANVTTFGVPAGIAATFDVELMRSIADVVGLEGRAMSQRDYKNSMDSETGLYGVSYRWLVCKDASEVNMNRHPLWGRNPETLGEDPYLTAAMGEAFTAQLQQPDPASDFLRVAAVTRHLAVYSGPETLKDDGTQGADRFAFNANVSDRDLEAYFYPPFEAALSRERGASAGAMCSDAAQNGVPSCASELLMTKKPREWKATDGFFVISDMDSYLNVWAQHKYADNLTDALAGELHAGLDLLYIRPPISHCRGYPNKGGASVGSSDDSCPQTAEDGIKSNETRDALDALTNGTVSDARFTAADLDAKAARMLRLRFDLGEFDPVDDANPYARPVNESVIDSAAHRKVARDAAAASIVLLENQDGALPLARTDRVALIGPWMKPGLQPSMGSKVNAYVHSYGGTSAEMVDFYTGLSSALKTPPIFAQGCETNQTLPGEADFASARRAAAEADVAVVALGLTRDVIDEQGVGFEKELGDRISLDLPRVQTELLVAVRSAAKRVVLVIVSGSAVPFNASLADAALYAMYGGAQAGNALADVLFGDVSPSGRLPFTVFKNLDQVRPMGDYDMTSQPGRTHLYYAAEKSLGAPQYWFGYGLSYSTFRYSKLVLAHGPAWCTVNVTVTNAGEASAREVVQVYLGRPALPNTPVADWALRGFKRTALLAPGESRVVQFLLTSGDLSTVTLQGSRTVLQGGYKVSVGGANPRDVNAPAQPVQGTFQLESTIALGR